MIRAMLWISFCEMAKAAYALLPGPLLDSCILENSEPADVARFHSDYSYRRFMRTFVFIVYLGSVYSLIPVMIWLWKTISPYAWQVSEIMKNIGSLSQ